MPTSAEFYELSSICTWTWETRNGMYGYTVTGSNGNSIFLPASGRRYGSSPGNCGSNGYYWSASLYSSSAFYYAYYLYFYSSSHYPGSRSDRDSGVAVRPVAEP